MVKIKIADANNLTIFNTDHFCLKPKETHTRKPQLHSVVAAVEIGGAQITVALVDERARLLIRRRMETPQTSARAVVSIIAKLLLEAAVSAERGASEIKAIGLSVHGIVEPQTGRVSAPEIKGWERFALRSMLEHELEAAGLDIRTPAVRKTARAEKSASAHPAIIINSDHMTSVAAEAWCGVASGKQHVVFVKLDAGISAGIIADGRILRGAGNIAGAAGWFALSEEFLDEYASRGCLETEAAGGALVRRTIEESSGGADSLLSRLTVADAAELTPEVIIRAARGGDALALKVITEACGWIGRGVADLISTLNPEVVVIGGELGLTLRPFLNLIRREARLWAHPSAARQCRILSSTLRQTAGLLGAARLAWLEINPTS